MTGRERMTGQLERRDHDRIPRHGGYWRETINLWKQKDTYQLIIELLDRFGNYERS